MKIEGFKELSPEDWQDLVEGKYKEVCYGLLGCAQNFYELWNAITIMYYTIHEMKNEKANKQKQ